VSGDDDDLMRDLVHETAQLRAGMEVLRQEIAALRNEVADLRASALLWQKLYEEAMRRWAERGGENVG
jgi:cell division protein FtsB